MRQDATFVSEPRRWVLTAIAAIAIGLAARSAAQETCVGDCKDRDKVDVSDLITGINIALGTRPTNDCPAFENPEGEVDIAQLVEGVSNAVNGCPDQRVTVSGSCAAPRNGDHDLQPCQTGTPITAFRCDDRALCLAQQGLTRVASTTVTGGGHWSVRVPMHDARVALIFQANIADAVIFRALGFASLVGALRAGAGSEVTFAPVEITPVTEASVQLLDSNGFDNYSDAGAEDVVNAVEQATADLSFAESTPSQAITLAFNTAQADPAVVMVLETARNRLAIQLVGAGPQATDPVPGIRVIRHDPTTGAVLAEVSTDANGFAEFANVGERATISFITSSDDPETRNGIFTFVNFPTAPFGAASPLRFNVFDIDVSPDRPTLATVDVTLTDFPAGTNEVRLFAGGFQQDGDIASGPVAEFPDFAVDQLQSDGKISFLAEAEDATEVIRGCGAAIDVDPANNTPLEVALDSPPTAVSFATTEAVDSEGVQILRKGAIFDLDALGTGVPVPSGTLNICPLPGAERYTLFLQTEETPSQSSKEIDVTFPALPDSFDATLPDLSIDSLARNANGTISWSRSGSDVANLDFALPTLEWVSDGVEYRWALVGEPAATSITLPALPADLSDRVPPASGVGLRLVLGGLDNADGFVDFFRKISAANGNFDLVRFQGTNAFFVERRRPVLALSKEGTGSGTVRSSPAGIDCGGTCAANFAAGIDVVLTAFPDSGSSFGFWSGACEGNETQITVHMDGDLFCVATFDAQ